MLCSVVSLNFTDVSWVFASSTTATMEAESTSETSANFYQTTRRNIPEYSHLQTPLIALRESENTFHEYRKEEQTGARIIFKFRRNCAKSRQSRK
jgi:hypothetical protein